MNKIIIAELLNRYLDGTIDKTEFKRILMDFGIMKKPKLLVVDRLLNKDLDLLDDTTIIIRSIR